MSDRPLARAAALMVSASAAPPATFRPFPAVALAAAGLAAGIVVGLWRWRSFGGVLPVGEQCVVDVECWQGPVGAGRADRDQG